MKKMVMMVQASSTHSRSQQVVDRKVEEVIEVVVVAKCGNKPNRKTQILSAHNLRKTSAIRIMVDVAAEAVEEEVVDRDGEEMETVAEAGVVVIMMMVVTVGVEEVVEATITITEGEVATVVVVEISHGEMGRMTMVETQVTEVAEVVVTIEDVVEAIHEPLEILWPTNNVSKNPGNPTDSRMMFDVECPFDRTEVDSGDEAFSD